MYGRYVEINRSHVIHDFSLDSPTKAYNMGQREECSFSYSNNNVVCCILQLP